MVDDVSPALAELLRNEIENFERLAADLRGILDGSSPSEAQLAAAPLIDYYQWVTRPVTCLAGHISGHPLGSSSNGRTSELMYIAKRKGWARTRSRYYRLGRRVDAPGDRAAGHGLDSGADLAVLRAIGFGHLSNGDRLNPGGPEGGPSSNGGSEPEEPA